LNVKVRILSLFLCFAIFPALAAAQSQTCTQSQVEPPFSCSVTFSPGTTGTSTGIFDFSGVGDGILKFQFDTVLTTFILTVSANETAPGGITNIDTNELPNTVCITYAKGVCVRYDVTGNVGGPNGTPVRGVDYKGLISVTLNYLSFDTIDIPVFGHDPELSPDFTENILTSYIDENAPPCTTCEDPAMGGKTPGISSFAALNQAFANGASSLIVCPNLTATPQKSTSGNNPIVEVTFKLASTSSNCTGGPFLRDKSATLTVGKNPGPTFVNLINNGDSNKFHFDNKSGSNVQDINTNGLASGTYFVTVISDQFSPVTTTFTIP